jgi:hypothetical protein
VSPLSLWERAGVREPGAAVPLLTQPVMLRPMFSLESNAFDA